MRSSESNSEETAFHLLYSMTGIRGASGETIYPIPVENALFHPDAVLAKLCAAAEAIENYKDTEEVDFLAIAEELLGQVEALIHHPGTHLGSDDGTAK